MVLNKAHIEPEAKPNQRKPAPDVNDDILTLSCIELQVLPTILKIIHECQY